MSDAPTNTTFFNQASQSHPLLDELKTLSSAKGLCKIERKKIDDLKDVVEKFIKEGLAGQPEFQASAPVARHRVKEVRELVYDIDDFIDNLVHDIAVGARHRRGRVSTIVKLGDCLSRRRRIVHEVSRFRSRLEEAISWQRPSAVASDAHLQVPPVDAATDAHLQVPPVDAATDAHLQVPPVAPATDAHLQVPPVDAATDAQLQVPPVAATRLIGTESSMNQIADWLTDKEDRQLRVISIVGLGGVGKTTLAKQLYAKLGWKFHRRAFVQSSPNPDMKRLLTSILLQVRPHRPPDAFESRNLVNTIRECLRHHRYFIIVDGIRALSTWDIVCQALPDNQYGSKILMTTEMDTIAQRCCDHNSKHILKIKQLNDDESRELFVSRLTGRGFECPDDSNKVPDELITKCGGLPLAINAIACLFARQHGSGEDWENIWNSLSTSFELNPHADDITQILCLCYDKLPGHLKSCMLYFSVYQEDHIIWKDDLVKQWIAEGFICEEQGKGLLEVACSYYDELIRMAMIQPADIKYNGEVLSCTVHYMILNLIRRMAIEENFVTVVDQSNTNRSPAGKIRRLSLQFGDEEDAEPPSKFKLSQVRTLVFCGLIKCLPTMEEFGLLRVLILHIWSDQENISFDLTGVCELFRLRYLEISCNVTLNLQSQLQGLQYLETLKIDSRVTELPPDIIGLQRLLHLSVSGGTNLPNGIGKLVSLETLNCFDLSRNSPDNVESLSKLTKLRDLHLTCSKVHSNNAEKNMVCLAKIVLPQLKYLKSLRMSLAPRSSNLNSELEASSSSNNNVSSDALSKMSSLPKPIERLELSPRVCIFSRFPKWIHHQRCNQLRIIKVAVLELVQNDVDTLKKLSELNSLTLYVWALAKRIVFHNDGFLALKHFKFISTALRIKIVKGAIPNVRRLKLGFGANTTEENSPQDCGFDHMTGLEEISAKIGTANADEFCTNAAQSKLEDTFRSHKVTIELVDSIFYGHQGMTTAAQIEDMTIAEVNIITNEGSDEQNRIGEMRPSDDSRSIVSTNSTLDMHILGVKSSSRPADADVLGDSKRIIKYVSMHLFKLRGLSMKTELASISLERELLSAIIEENWGNSPAEALPERWVIQAQQLVHDLDDFVDVYKHMHAVCLKAKSKSTRIRWRSHTLAHLRRIVHLKHRLSILQQWQQKSIPNTQTESISRQAPIVPYVPLHREGLVGMDEPVRQITESLLQVSDNKERAISITGCCGVGKSTLAASVYYNDDVLSHFNLCAWVVASECNSAEDIIKTIKQLYGERLQGRRCLVVIDDLRQGGMWHDIRSVLAGADLISRIIVTTCIESVAAECSPQRYIFRMRGLDHSTSTELFWGRLDGRVHRTPALDNDLQDTFRRCDGLPLALVGAAADYLRGHGQGMLELQAVPAAAFEGVNRVVMQLYNSLPDYGHRACLLSLSIFPQGHCINRKSLIRRWVAEGLVREDSARSRPRSAEQVGGDIFRELVDRNIIEPAVPMGNNSSVKRWRVRGAMLDFIINTAISKAFVTLLRQNELLHTKEGAHPVRRLSVVHGSTAENGRAAAGLLNHARSLTVHHGYLFDLQTCRLLRVLDLEGCKGVDEWTLQCICKMVLLRYLSLRCSDVRQIPNNIKKLEYLETLDLRETQVNKLPMEVILLPQLVHLFGRFELPRELQDEKNRIQLEEFFEERSALQTLSGFVMDGNDGFEVILHHMRFLRKVKVWSKHSITTDATDVLAYALQKGFSKKNGLQSLSIDFGEESIDFLDSVLLEGPSILSSIKLRGRLSRLPNFITLLDNISELQLSLTCLSIEDLSVLQHFPLLRFLKLVEGPRAFWGGSFVVQKGGFPSLERLWFEGPELPVMQIHEEGMSAVTSLHLLCPKLPLWSEFEGIKNLKHINEVVLHPSVDHEVLDGWKAEARKHKNRPKVHLHNISA